MLDMVVEGDALKLMGLTIPVGQRKEGSAQYEVVTCQGAAIG